MKTSPPQKSISLPTALLAAATGVAFLWASISSSLERPASSVPVSFTASPQLSGPVHVVGSGIATATEIRNAGQLMMLVVQNLKGSELDQQMVLSGFDCLHTTTFRDSRGKFLSAWKAMHAGINRCLIKVNFLQANSILYTITVDGLTAKGPLSVVFNVRGEWK